MKIKSHSTRNISFLVNGLRLSIGMGNGHYGSNHSVPCDYDNYDTQEYPPAETVEMAVIVEDTGDWYTKEIWMELYGEELHDDVVGYVAVDELPKILDYLNKRV
jgi:hypothetical protein